MWCNLSFMGAVLPNAQAHTSDGFGYLAGVYRQMSGSKSCYEVVYAAHHRNAGSGNRSDALGLIAVANVRA